MFNFFEQPWTLFIAAIVVLYIVFRFRSIFPQKRCWWQWLIPVIIAAAAFGLDYSVETDFEKIKSLIDGGIKAVEEENPGAIEVIISENYQDSYHESKEKLMSLCRSEMLRSPVEENKKIHMQIEISPPDADVGLTVMMKFDKDSYIAQNYKQVMLVKLKLYLKKQPDGKWLISRSELLEIDRNPINWEQIR